MDIILKKALIVTRTPMRITLGGSRSFEVGLLNALYAFKNQKGSQILFAKQAFSIEIDRKGNVSVEALKLSEKTILDLEKNLQGIYNIASSENITLQEVANLLKKKVYFGSYI